MKHIIICLIYFVLLCMINVVFNNMKIVEAIVWSIITVCAFGLYKTLKSRKENGGKLAMKERVKIVTDGEKAEVYIDGKKVKCTDMELHFSGHVDSKPMITVDAQWHKADENGNVILNNDKTEVLTEGIKTNC